MNLFSFDIARHIKFRMRDVTVWDKDLQVLQNCTRGGASMIPTIFVVELQAKFWHHNTYYGKHKRCWCARHAPANLVCICIYPKQIYTGFGCMSLALVGHKSWECWILSISAYWSVITCPDTSAFTAKFESNLCTSHLQVYNRTLVTDIKSQLHGFVCKFQKMSVLWKCSNLAGRSENKARAPWSNAYEWWWRWIYRIYD